MNRGKAREDITLLDVLIDGFEKNEILCSGEDVSSGRTLGASGDQGRERPCALPRRKRTVVINDSSTEWFS